MTQEFYISLIILMLLLMLLGLGVTVIVLYIKFKKLQEKLQEVTKSKQELEGQIQPLELETIKYKLNPHLFKNVLNSIQSHAYQTYYSLDKLANVLDYVLYESDAEMVSLKEELEFVLNLIEINRIKISPLFDLRVKNKINYDNKWFREKIIAPLITVDLIENAFKHSDIQSGDSFISIVFEIEEDDFILTVANKISQAPALKKAKGGFGSHNFKRRLNIIYGDHFQLNQSSSDGVYTAQLKLNLDGYKAQMSST